MEAVPHVSPESTWVFLINHGGEQLSFNTRTARTFGPVPPYPIVLEIALAGRSGPKRVSAAGADLAFELDTGSGILSVPLTMDIIWRVVQIDWE